MKRLYASPAWPSLFAASLFATISGGAVRSAPACRSLTSSNPAGRRRHSAARDNKLAYKGCMQDENDALKQLQQNWSRYLPENRSNCLAQGLSPMPSYVEILTCIEMYDSAGLLNKGSAASQMNQGVPPMTPASPAPADSK